MSEELAEVVAGGWRSPLAAGPVLAAQEELPALWQVMIWPKAGSTMVLRQP